MSEKIVTHFDCHVGLTMDDAVITEHTNGYGQHYFRGVQRIGSIFGSEVNGEINVTAATLERVMERLLEERHKLSESLWY